MSQRLKPGGHNPNTASSNASRHGLESSFISSFGPLVQAATSVVAAYAVDEEAAAKTSLERLDKRNETEKKFFELVEDGDEEAVQKYFSENISQIDINVKDLAKQDVLSKAVAKKDLDMVELLLKVDPIKIDVYDALLGAIKEDYMDIFKRLIEHYDNQLGYMNNSSNNRDGDNMPTLRRKSTKTKKKMKTSYQSQKRKDKDGDKANENEPDPDLTEYGKDMKPMTMAAMHGHYEIMHVLYERKERLRKLLCPPSCKSCEICERLENMEFRRDLQTAEARLNLLKAHCNPTYLIFMAGKDGDFDPVYEAFLLTNLVGMWIEFEQEFLTEYTEILEKIYQFPCELLDMCRTTEETKTFMKPRKGYEGPYKEYPRVVLALHMEQKHFVAHPHAQYLIHQDYIGEGTWYTKSTLEWIIKKVFKGFQFFFFPLITIFLWFAMFCCKDKRQVQYLLAPCSRVRSKLGSYFWFCYLLICMNSAYKTQFAYRPPTEYVRYVVVVYVFCHIIALFRHYTYNSKHFFRRWSNWWDIVTNLLFVSSFGIWLYNYFMDSSVFASDHNRKLLNQWDPVIIGEISFAFASTLAILRFCRACVLSATFGPHLCSLKQMFSNYWYFMFFYLLMIPTFGLGVQMLFRPYVNVVNVKDGKVVTQPGAEYAEFGMYWFWDMDRQFSRNQMQLLKIPFNISNETYFESAEHEQYITDKTLKFIGIVYILIIGVFFKTLAKGVMGSVECKSKIKAEKHVEWLFTRCREWLYYIEDSYLAPPFNLILPTADGVKRASAKRKDNPDIKKDEEERKQYAYLLRKIFQRYFQFRKREETEKNKPAKGDVETIQETIRRLKELAKKLE